MSKLSQNDRGYQATITTCTAANTANAYHATSPTSATPSCLQFRPHDHPNLATVGQDRSPVLWLEDVWLMGTTVCTVVLSPVLMSTPVRPMEVPARILNIAIMGTVPQRGIQRSRGAPSYLDTSGVSS